MTQNKFNAIILEIKQGNIVDQPDCDAIVNAANAQLRTGGGVAGAIHTIGDPELTEETRSMAPISPGEAVISSAPNFPNKHIIHCLGPVYGKDKPEDKFLKNCYENALKIADENMITSIAFPAISTGVFGYPKKEAAKIALTTVMDLSGSFEHVLMVRFVLFGEDDYQIHKEVLKEITG
ncbi:macro domain-containing protein [Rhodohalobacter sp. 614A]|uniref:macro domain-containing protein n=1 Tax=Rhodohalobacter sp. 614A TaxID=2908649 RepID=UPI001F1D3104|nr:macro domain-containing protein [Rhodohalobacter sp. 614A]